MKAKKKRMGKRFASNDSVSGVLATPYGYIGINYMDHYRVKVENGHPVKNGKLVGISLEHKVPSHWIKPDND